METSLEASGIHSGGFGRIAPTEAEEAELSALANFDEIAARIDDHAEGDPAIETDEAVV
ncbi:hypothetical protein [Sinorhizobium meliloti]|uniref:hypothetical protein n=1 Tax=Rhizobium meliloti TaxID=382 RepID=UPI0018657A66|nr:hypothetical protein [Sinorhizobium meliloti]MDE3854368.1 hypothetical protein [Sinorhizobium meliloti]